MPRRRLLTTVLPALLLAGALTVPVAQTGQDTEPVTAAAITVVAPAATPTPRRAAEAAVPTVDAAAVLATVQAAAAAAGGTVAVSVLDAAGTTVVASADAATPEYTASLVKLLVVQQLLARDGAGTLTLTDDDLALMQAAVEASDDDAMSELWVAFDGDGLVAAAAEEFGLTGTAAPAEAGQWGEATTTAADYATFLAALPSSLSANDATLLGSWMQATTATAADGFDQTFGLLSLPATGTAAKQGWMCCLDDERQLHSAGVLADGTVVVLLGTFPSSTSWAEAAAALDAAAAAVTA